MQGVFNRCVGVYLSLALAFSLLVAGLCAPKQAHAIVPALAVPAAAAAVGIDGTTALTVFAGIMTAATGVSLAAYVGANSDDISSWTQEQVDKAGALFERWVPNYDPGSQLDAGRDVDDVTVGYRYDPDKGTYVPVSFEQYWLQDWANRPQLGDGGDGGDGGGGNKWNEIKWGAIIDAVKKGGLPAALIGCLGAGLIGQFSGTDSKQYPIAVQMPDVDLNGTTFHVNYEMPVDSYVPSSGHLILIDREYLAWGPGMPSPSDILYNCRDTEYIYGVISSYSDGVIHTDGRWSSHRTGYKVNSSELSVSDYTSSNPIGIPDASSSVQSRVRYYLTPYSASFCNPNYGLEPSGYPSVSDAPDSVRSVSSSVASTALTSDKDVSSDAYQQAAKDYAKEVTTSGRSFVSPYVLSDSGTVVRNDAVPSPFSYEDVMPETKTDPQPDPGTNPDPQPDPGTNPDPQPDPGTNPDPQPGSTDWPIPGNGYKFPDSWAEIKWNRVFPFWLADDAYQVVTRLFPAKEYNPRVVIPISAEWWGGSGTEDLVIDFSIFDSWNGLVMFVEKVLFFVGFLLALSAWWGGFSSRGDSRAEEE